MTAKPDLLVAPLDGFTPQIGRLVSMMHYVRSTTIEAVDGLSMAQLDHLHDDESNSIGALLDHIAAAEAGYQAATFFDRALTEDEKREWGAALDLSGAASRAIRGHQLSYYVGRLAAVRATTLAELSKRDDAWLEQESVFGDRRRVNNHFKWFHVIGHEVNHCGQIRWLRKRATRNHDP
jgi:hypothetical protein